MDLFQAMILGAVQGLTEFLPVSSSGHLVLFQQYFGLIEPELLFDVSVHMGTLAAVLLIYRKKVAALISNVFLYLRSLFMNDGPAYDKENLNFVIFIIAGSVPTAVIGLVIKKFHHIIFSSVALVGVMLLITCVFLLLTRFFGNETGAETVAEKKHGLTFTSALIIGVIQGFAVFPGISRSGSTISTALMLGVNRKTAAEFSFLLSVPAIVGAEILSLKEAAFASATPLSIISAGSLVSAVVGYLALKFLIALVNKGRLHLFAPYCLALGILAIIIGAG